MPLTANKRISVALCTYNGERFLAPQLTSIAQQTRPPDELVVCDDRSTDRTVALLREFAASVSYPVRIFENRGNLGSSANFEQAIRLCNGDLIALSDQDDIWYPIRLERSAQELTNHPHAGLVFSDADLIDETGELLGESLWHRLGFAGKRKQELQAGQFVLLAKHRFVTGATVMFRADLRDRCLPIATGWIHDEWIALIIAALSALQPIDQSLIRYRIHNSQQVGFQNKLEQRVAHNPSTQKHWDRLSESARELQQLCDVLSSIVPDPNAGPYAAYRRHLRFLAFRSGLPANRLLRLAPILSRPFQYRMHASGPASMLKDLLVKRRPAHARSTG